MNAAFLTDIRQVETRQTPLPELTCDTDVRIRIQTVGVCGSDIHYYTTGRIGSQIVQFPFIIGHEAAGVVEKTGSKVSRVTPGQRIAIDPAVSCGHCDQCLAGREHTCRQLRFLGCPGQLQGSLCEYVVLPEQCCFPVPETMTFEQSALSEPLAIACIRSNDRVFHPEATWRFSEPARSECLFFTFCARETSAVSM